MAVTANWYGLGMKSVMTGVVDLDTDTFKLMLTTSAYTPNQDTDQFRSSVTNEISGTGYSAGGVTLASVTVTYDATSNETRFDFADPQWTSATFTAHRAVVYKSRGGLASADDLVFWIDFGADDAVSAGTFTIVGDVTGFAKVTVA